MPAITVSLFTTPTTLFMSDDLTPSARSISDIISQIDEGKLLLPEFQRNFTWSISQSIELFDSLARNIFIGSLILSTPKFDLACRNIDQRPRKGLGSRKVIMADSVTARDFESKKIEVVLDGQQRITALYRAVTGIDVLYIVLPSIDSLDLQASTVDIHTANLRFSDEQDDTRISIPLHSIYRLQNEMEEDFIARIIRPEINRVEVARSSVDIKLINKYILRLRKSLEGLLNNNRIVSMYLLDMDIQKFCLFFERSNSRGIPLDFIDIVTAKVYVDFNIRQKVSEYKERNNDESLDDRRNLELLIRYVSFKRSKQVDKKSILEFVTGEAMNQYWDEATDTFHGLLQHLKANRTILGVEWFPYRSMLTPLMAVRSLLPRKDLTHADQKIADAIQLWIWYSMLTHRYGGGKAGSTNVVIVEDCSRFIELHSGALSPADFVRKYRRTVSKENMLEPGNNNSSLFVGVNSILNADSPFLELANSQPFEFDPRNRVHVHHFFPDKYLEKTYGSDSDEYNFSDTIANKILIGEMSNLKIAALPPSIYLKTVNPFNVNTTMKSALSSHRIPNPERLLDESDGMTFQEFIEIRSQLLAEECNRILDDKFHSLSV